MCGELKVVKMEMLRFFDDLIFGVLEISNLNNLEGTAFHIPNM